MLANLRYILIVMLFTAMGALCRTQAAQHVASFGGKSFFVEQSTTCESAAARLSGHSFLAPELINEVQTHQFQFSDQKTPAKFTFGHTRNLTAQLWSGNLACHNVVHLHPHASDYYIFSLEKIRI